MKKRFKHSNDNGFSLVELIVVIVIILILAVVLVPSVHKYISKAREAVLVNEASDLVNGTCLGIIDAYTHHPADYKKTVKLNKYASAGEKYGFYSSYLLATHQGNASSSSTNAKDAITKGVLEYLSGDIKNTKKFKFYNGMVTGGFDISNVPEGEIAFIALYNEKGGVIFAQYAKDGYLITFDGKTYDIKKGGKFIVFN